MALIEPLTKLDTYKEYMRDIGKMPSYQLKQCFACGLPGIWLYMRAIGLEDVYFDIIKRAKQRSIWFKELFYLLLIANTNNKFFPKVPKDILKIEIPKEIVDAQVSIQQPDFEMVYAFDREQLKETLEQIALPKKMVRLGNNTRAVGLMYDNNVYHLYHAESPVVQEFKNLDLCVDQIMQVME